MPSRRSPRPRLDAPQESTTATKTGVVVPVKATVANLTLLAFGSSVPEILLSEIVTGRFFAGGLAGPSTVVASAAFKLLLLLFLLLLAVVLAAELRIEGLGTYAYTAVLSVSLVVILRLSSPNVLGLMEALSTFAMFPLLVRFANQMDLGKAKLGAACQAKPTLAKNFSMAACSVAGGSTVAETTAIGNGERAAPVTVVNCKATAGSVLKSAGKATCEVTGLQVDCMYATEGVAASAGKDRVQTPGGLAFSLAEMEVEVTVALVGDDEPEKGEMPTVKLANPRPNAELGSEDVAVATIIDGDGGDGGGGDDDDDDDDGPVPRGSKDEAPPVTSQRRSSWKCPALNRAACVALCFLALWTGVANAAALPGPKDGGWGASNQQREPGEPWLVQDLEETRLQVWELERPRLQVQGLKEARLVKKDRRVRETDPLANPEAQGQRLLLAALLPALMTMNAERQPSDAAEVWRPRALTSVTVSTQSELNSALASGATIELAANIALTATVNSGAGVYISGKTGLVIDGMGLYEVNGQNARRCFYITGHSEVALQGLTVTNGTVVSCSTNRLLCSKTITQDFLIAFISRSDAS